MNAFTSLLERLDLSPIRGWLEGRWQDAEDHLDLLDPYRSEVIARLPAMGHDETQAAIQHAVTLQPAWGASTWAERCRILTRWADAMENHTEDLARLMVWESGKTIRDARAEAAYAQSFVRFYADPALEPKAATLAGQPKRLVCHRPLGVVGAITPWNFPAAMVTRKIAPALAAGCTVILKPSEETPLTALALGKLLEQAGLPQGVVQILTGPPEPIGKGLCEHPSVRGISFTGSTAVGRRLMTDSAPTVKKLDLELGGNAPFIVLEGANLAAALDGLMHAKFRNAGQTCIAPNRILLQRSIAEDFLSALTARLRGLKLGDPQEEVTDLGPLIRRSAAERVRARVEDAVRQGATLWLPDECSELPDGNLVPPTLLTSVTPAMRVWQEENFGPVIPVMPVDSAETALQEANATDAGLAAYLYAPAAKLHSLAARLEYGMAGLNSVKLSHASAPFGGMKQSGLGREGGPWGLEGFLEIQYLCEEDSGVR